MSRIGETRERVVYRSSDTRGERERDYDDRSSQFLRAEPREAPYVTRKTYRIPREREEEIDERVTILGGGGGSDRRSIIGTERDRGGFEENRVVIRRERTPEPPQPERREREIRVVERERSPEPRRFEREYRYERDLDRRDDLERYTRSVEYFPRPDPPQPIIIRQEPQQIIIQEAPRPPLVVQSPPPKEENFELIQRSEVQRTERSEVGEERQLARRPKPKEEEEEDYYYERRVREVSRDNRDDERFSRVSRRHEREVSPGDSVSNVGRARHDDRYDSDESYEYVRKEVREDGYSDEEPRHRRHLAEGAALGVGAAELLRHHRSKSGRRDDDSRRSRVGKDVGAAALGAIGAEAVTRARSAYRERSKSRHGSRDRYASRERRRSRDRESRRKHKSDRRERSRSRSQSASRVKQLAGLGLGAAAVAAAVGYANRKNKQNNAQVEDRRSRSRHRKHSPDASTETTEDARNPKHRNTRLAQAGAAGAAVAALVERARSKSRGDRGKSRSKSRLRQGIPIAAAGLGSAAIAGLYENNQKNKKEKEAAKEAAKEERHSKRERRARSRSQQRDLYEEGSRDAPLGDPAMLPGIEYGDQPIYNSAGAPGYYGERPPSQQGYYPNQDALVPAATAGAAYGEQRERERQREISSSESDNGGRSRRRRHRRKKSDSRSRSRSRSRTKQIAAGTAAAGAGAYLASEHEQRKQRRKEEKRERRRREQAEQASYGQDPYAQQPYSPPPGAGYPTEGQAPYYPPPPVGAPPYQPQANYSQDYQGQPGAPPGGQVHPDYGYPPQGGPQVGYAPPVPDAYSPPPGAAGYQPQQQQPREPRRADENVSDEVFQVTPNIPTNNAPLYDPNGIPFYTELDNALEESGEGVNTPRAQSPSRPKLQRRASSQPPPTTKFVHFNPDPISGTNSPIRARKHRKHVGSSKHQASNHSDGYDSEDGPSRTNTMRDKDMGDDHHRHHHRSSTDSRSPSPSGSDSTIDLPDRFDDHGRRIPERGDDDLAQRLEDLFSGRGRIGSVLQSFGLSGGSGISDEDRRRRRRRR